MSGERNVNLFNCHFLLLKYAMHVCVFCVFVKYAMECNAVVSFIRMFRDFQTCIFFLSYLKKESLLFSHVIIKPSVICFNEKEMPQSWWKIWDSRLCSSASRVGLVEVSWTFFCCKDSYCQHFTTVNFEKRLWIFQRNLQKASSWKTSHTEWNFVYLVWKIYEFEYLFWWGSSTRRSNVD